MSADCTLDVDWAVVFPFCEKNSYKDRAGEVVYGNILGLHQSPICCFFVVLTLFSWQVVWQTASSA